MKLGERAVRGLAPLTAAAALAASLVGCAGVASCPQGEAILFARIPANNLIADSLQAVCPDGSRLRTIIPAIQGQSGTRGIYFASGNSLATQIAVDVFQYSPSTGLEESAQIALPSTGKLEPFVPMPGSSGLPALSPENDHVVYEFSAAFPQPLSLWDTDLKTCANAEIDDPPAPWQDDDPVWRPDGKEILFGQYAPSGPGRVDTRLVSLAIPPGEPQVLFGPEEDVGSESAFSPDGERFAVVARGALEVVDRNTLAQTVIFPSSARPPGRYFSGPGLAWSPTLNLIAFVLCNGQGSACAIWTIRPDGSKPHSILTTTADEVTLSSFVRDSLEPAPAGFVPYRGDCANAAGASGGP